MNIFIVDDEEQVQKVLKLKLEKEKYNVLQALSSDEFVTAWDQGKQAPIVVTDIRMPGRDGFWLLKWVKEQSPSTRVIVITGHGEKKMAVEALRLGATDYLEKPFDLDELVHSVKRCEKEWEVENERNQLLKRLEARAQRLEVELPAQEGVFSSKSPSMKEVAKWLDVLKRESKRSAQAEEPSVLILGETGSGKEVIARRIHAESSRASGPWIAVNCANLSENLLESELFGHEKGSFTGASQTKLGLFELARGGSLFLDEIGEMPQSLQAKLLRVLQEKKIRHVGGTQEITVDVRVIAATHVNLEEQMKSKKFREDLYHRLAQVVLKLPALRDRQDELAALTDFFFKRAAHARGKKFTGFTDEAQLALRAYTWPGNIRELINLAERSALLLEDGGGEKIPLEWLGLPKARGVVAAQANGVSSSDDSYGFGKVPFSKLREQMVSQFESSYLRALLAQTSGNVTQAAKLAKIDRSNLNKLIKKFKA